MLPKLRIILAAVFATCAALLALSAGMLGARDPGDDLGGVPEISRTLVRQAIVAEPDRQQVQLLAYSRRADELLRLRDLPVTPTRAVVDYAEHAQARAAETASAPAAPAATSPIDTAAASDSGPAADVPAAPAADSATGATPPTDALPPAMVAMAPVANPHGDTTAGTAVVQPVSPPPVDAAPARTEAAAAPAPDDAPAASAPVPAAFGDTRVAAVAPGGSATAETYGPEKPKTEGKPHHHARVARPHPKKKAQVAVGNTRPAPAPSTGSPVNQPNNRNNAVGGWRTDNAPR